MEQRSVRVQRFRGTRKRIRRLRISSAEAWLGLLMGVFILVSAIASAWLVITFHEY